MEIRIAVGVADLLIIDLAEPVVGSDGTGVGQDQPAHGVGDSGVFLDSPVRHPQIVVNQLFIVQHGGAYFTQPLPVLSVKNVGFCNGRISGTLQHRLHAVLNVLHTDLVVLDLAGIVRRHLQCKQIDDIRVVGDLRRVKRLCDGLCDTRQVKVHLSSVPFDYLIHKLHSFKCLAAACLECREARLAAGVSVHRVYAPVRRRTPSCPSSQRAEENSVLLP